MENLVSMREGTVVLPFISKRAAFTAYGRVLDAYLGWLWKQNPLEALGITLHPEIARPEFNLRTYEASEEWHLIARKNRLAIKPVFFLVPVQGPVLETHFHHWQMAKIPKMPPAAVLMNLQTQGVSLADLEGPLAAVFGWEPYRKGHLISPAQLSRLR